MKSKEWWVVVIERYSPITMTLKESKKFDAQEDAYEWYKSLKFTKDTKYIILYKDTLLDNGIVDRVMKFRRRAKHEGE